MIIPPAQPGHRTITISQTSHSWISGQLARAWGNDNFTLFEPFEQMCYAAEQHDIGFLDWESQPTLNVDTGLPYTFDELPESIHFEIWHKGIFQLACLLLCLTGCFTPLLQPVPAISPTSIGS